MFQQLATLGGLALATAVLTLPSPTPATTQPLQEGAYQVDGVHSSALFSVIHFGTARFYGRFNDISGTIEFDEDKPEDSKVSITIAADSVDTGNEKRDQHLRSPDFFSAKEFETITFESKRVKVAKKAKGDEPMMLEIQGQLDFAGKQQDVTAMVEHVGTGKGMGGVDIVGFEARFTIERSDFDVNYMLDNGGLSDEVDVILSVEAGRR